MEDQYLAFAIKAAALAGNKLLEHYSISATNARCTPKEIKTTFDEIADEAIKQQLESTFPDHSYVTEETGLVQKDSEFLWIIDPLDGTGNFMNSNPFFAVSIALWKGGKPLLGVIEAPMLNERYIAMQGQGAWVINIKTGDKRPAKVSEVSELSKSYIVYCHGGSHDRQQVLKSIESIYPKAKDTRILGSAALELAWVGTGRAEAYITPEISIWDIAAGVIFVQEAGGSILDFSNVAHDLSTFPKLNQVNLLATNGKIKLPNLLYAIN